MSPVGPPLFRVGGTPKARHMLRQNVFSAIVPKVVGPIWTSRVDLCSADPPLVIVW